jgi:release factor glutamine methyltransferase
LRTLHDLVVDAGGRLDRAGIRESEARLDAESLARLVLGWDRARFLSHRHDRAPAGFREDYDRLIDRRTRREPTSYIRGTREFWGLDFEVSGDVLIPRPESEFLVEEALAWGRAAAARSARPLIVDAGTGSGCLAVVLAREMPGARLVATDISALALVVARRNALRHGVASRVWFLRANFLAGIGDAPDLIVANPPYVPHAAAPGLSPEVREFEPHVALFGGADGLDHHRTVLAQAAALLEPRGCLLMEFGDGQEDALRAVVAAWPCFRVLRVREDLQGIPRTMGLEREDHVGLSVLRHHRPEDSGHAPARG